MDLRSFSPSTSKPLRVHIGSNPAVAWRVVLVDEPVKSVAVNLATTDDSSNRVRTLSAILKSSARTVRGGG